MIILDTCALLWLASGAKKLSSQTLKKIQEAPAVYVSAITGFEVATKVAKGKLRLSAPVTEWFAQTLENHGIEILNLDAETCIRAAELPSIHDDPCDRFIIAAARLNNFLVVTRDERFAEYGIEVLD